MSESTPAVNMAVLANAAEMTRIAVSSMINEESVAHLFGQSLARENVYRVLMMAVNRRLSVRLNAMPSGQFNKSVQTGGNTSGQTNPNAGVPTLAHR